MKPISHKDVLYVENKYKAISNINRIRIINFLLEGEKYVRDIERYLNTISQPVLTEHLRKLVNYGILGFTKKKNHIYYYIEDTDIVKAMSVYGADKM